MSGGYVACTVFAVLFTLLTVGFNIWRHGNEEDGSPNNDRWVTDASIWCSIIAAAFLLGMIIYTAVNPTVNVYYGR